MERIIIYTDGSCLANGTTNASSGAGVYFGEDDPRNASFPVPGAQTNNRAELWAIIKALDMTTSPVEIRSDSRLSIKCAQRTWQAKANLDLFEQLWEKMKNRDVIFTWVRGHDNEIGNEASDTLAKEASKKKKKEADTKKKCHDA